MTKGSNFWVIGGEFGSMNFHKLVEGSAQVKVRSRPARKPRMPGARSRKRTATRPASASPSWKSPARRPDLLQEDVQGRKRSHPVLPAGAVFVWFAGCGPLGIMPKP